MKLSQAVEILKKPKSKSLIAKGKVYESRLRMYTEPLEEEDLKKELAWKRFDTFLKNVLSEKKHKRIKDFIRYPLTAVDISESTLTDIYKVFDASNAYFNYETDKEKEVKLEASIEMLNIIEFIKFNGKQVLKNKPNTFVVLDKDDKGEEYFLTIDNDRIEDFSFNENGDVEYIVFCHSETKNDKDEIETRFSIYCDEYYRVFLKKGDTFVNETENPHNIGQCPARMFMSDEVSTNDPFNKRVPLTSVLSKIEEWQIFDIYQFYVNHYGPFPIIERAEENCSVEGCTSGVIPKEETYYEDEILRSRTIFSKCPSCSDKSMIGPGTIVEIPATHDKDDPNGAGILKMISPSVENLKYIQDKQNAVEDYIYLKTVGANTLLDSEAVNKLQVKGSFETRKGVLMKLKPNLDNLYKWMITILAKSINGKASNIFVHADFGTEFHLTTEEEIQKRYSTAKSNGMPEVEIDTIYMQLIETKYKSNPLMTERMWIIKMLDSCPHDNFDMKSKKYQAGLISEEEYHISSRILSFVERFEVENTDLVSFGKLLPLREKLSKILIEFKNYANEYISTKPPQGSTEPSEQLGGGYSTK